MSRVIEILMLQALAYQVQGAIVAALAPLERALTLAESEGYVRLFVDEGPAMAHLLHEAAAREIHLNYVRTLLAAFPRTEGRELRAESLEHTRAVLSPQFSALVEPLSQRELEVLRLFKTELSGPEIARELMIGLSTVRTYTKSIYGKLNVNSRQAAVKRAAELGLI
jgi:LuxR family maltose regulon positive regulatory protein